MSGVMAVSAEAAAELSVCGGSSCAVASAEAAAGLCVCGGSSCVAVSTDAVAVSATEVAGLWDCPTFCEDPELAELPDDADASGFIPLLRFAIFSAEIVPLCALLSESRLRLMIGVAPPAPFAFAPESTLVVS